MSPDPQPPGSVRSVADINDDIRQLWQQAGGTLTHEQKARYSDLLAEYAAAVAARIVKAA
ncbi:hypothetical protein [Streptomyces sp. NBC_01373]|uniref:hypothetical protein n=1 Tax=Streptomyces sp. NBC_01373 TaxID=2903843 RepID=UPI00224E4D83|nr:hypothetical protein [Streptomyces sp. NBC_01373]MCX4703851.1 hypothetical protein [Streptomyces sp. NBC_01373]